MFPKCFLDVPNIATLREHAANIPGIVRAGWEGFLLEKKKLKTLSKEIKHKITVSLDKDLKKLSYRLFS